MEAAVPYGVESRVRGSASSWPPRAFDVKSPVLDAAVDYSVTGKPGYAAAEMPIFRAWLQLLAYSGPSWSRFPRQRERWFQRKVNKIAGWTWTDWVMARN